MTLFDTIYSSKKKYNIARLSESVRVELSVCPFFSASYLMKKNKVIIKQAKYARLNIDNIQKIFIVPNMCRPFLKLSLAYNII